MAILEEVKDRALVKIGRGVRPMDQAAALAGRIWSALGAAGFRHPKYLMLTHAAFVVIVSPTHAEDFEDLGLAVVLGRRVALICDARALQEIDPATAQCAEHYPSVEAFVAALGCAAEVAA